MSLVNGTKLGPYEVISPLGAGDLSRLKLKWAFGFPNDLHAFSQPSVVGGRVFVGSESGTVYSLDAATGCTRWSFKAEGPVRTATTVGVLPRPALVSGEAATTRLLVFFGDQNGYVYALDAESGMLRWKVRADSHEAAAKMFEKHPHFMIFPGDRVEVMPVMPIPGG